MKYFSELTKELYDSEEALFEAEDLVKQKEKEKAELKEQRAKRAEEVEAAYKEAVSKYEEANELLKKFCADYGVYHKSFTNNDIKNYNSLFDWAFNRLF